MVCSMINDNLAPPSTPWQHCSLLSEMFAAQCGSSKRLILQWSVMLCLVVTGKLAFLRVLFHCLELEFFSIWHNSLNIFTIGRYTDQNVIFAEFPQNCYSICILYTEKKGLYERAKCDGEVICIIGDQELLNEPCKNSSLKCLCAWLVNAKKALLQSYKISVTSG